MAKKGGQQQLQVDIQTDEEYEKFLERKGLLVMDVYTEWCGPCLAMVGSLKKIKLELGGDNLQLAICKSDTIEDLKRFRNKSEPTWLFASHGKIVNIKFGTNVPKLMQLIAKELEIELAYADNKAERTFYERNELLPIEKARLDAILAAGNEALKIEQDEAKRKRREYLIFVTSEITKNLPECGVTIFGPHISRDIFKKVNESAEALGLTCRDRRIIQIVPTNIEVLHFQCENPLADEVLAYIFNKDLLICLWKLEKPDLVVEEILRIWVDKLTIPQPVYDEFGVPVPDASIPPLIQPFEVEVTKAKRKVTEDVVNTEKPEDENLSRLELDGTSLEDVQNESPDQEKPQQEETNVSDQSQPNAKQLDETDLDLKILIPPIWAPADKVTNAAAVYLYFRTQTEPFLPPDPVPDPPHLAIAFEAYKRKTIFELCEQYKESILTYGYFDSSTPDKANLIANSTSKYEARQQTLQDKLILKVAKVTSHAILALSAQGPTHVSQNTVIGEQECRKFFPEGYKVGDGEPLESNSQLDASNKKKKKKKKKGEGGEGSDTGQVTSDAGVPEEVMEIDGEIAEEAIPQDVDSACQDEECPLKNVPEEKAMKGEAF